MMYERFEMSLIVPFGYNLSFYEKIGTEEETGGELYFQRKAIRSDRLNEQNEDMWKDEEQGLVRCLELQPKYRKNLGLHDKENRTYRLENRQDIPFKISKVNGWFFKSGEGYLTLHVRTDGLNEKQILDLRAILSDIKAEKKICYTVKTGRDQTKEMNFTVKDRFGTFLRFSSRLKWQRRKELFSKRGSFATGSWKN